MGGWICREWKKNLIGQLPKRTYIYYLFFCATYLHSKARQEKRKELKRVKGCVTLVT